MMRFFQVGRRWAVLAGCALFAAVAAAAGPKAYVGNFADNTVSVVDIGSAAVVAAIPVVMGPHGMAVSPDGLTVYVSGDGASAVSVIDTATDKVARTIDVGKSPHGLAMSRDGSLLLAGVYGDDRVAFIDTATQAVVATVPVDKPHTIALRPDGREAYVASQAPGRFALVVIDLASRTVSRRVPLEKPPRDLEFGYDGAKLYFTMAGVNAVQVLDPAGDRIVAEVPTGASPHLANVFRGAPGGAAIVQGPGEVLLFDPATNKPIRSIAVGKQPHWMAAATGGGTLYVTNEGSNSLSVVDLASGTTKTITVGNAPRKVVVQPDAARGAASGKRIEIRNFAFAPAETTVAAGDTVVWTNDDGAPHGLAFADGAAGTGVLLPEASFQRTFDRPGSYDYVCAVHPYMTGRVIVRTP